MINYKNNWIYLSEQNKTIILLPVPERVPHRLGKLAALAADHFF